MRIKAGIVGLSEAKDEAVGDTAQHVTGCMAIAAEGLKMDLRKQVEAAGLGTKLANTWRSRVYPDQGKRRASLSPAGFVWTRAPEIIDAFDRGATIRPHGGGQYLWLPTNNVPRDRDAPRGSHRKAGPFEVELQFNQDLIIRNGRGGNKLAFIRAVRGRNGRGVRQATSRRVASGREVELILMFTLVPLVKLPKDLDVQAAAERAAARVVNLIGGS